MAYFPQTVNAPGAASFNAPQVNFGDFANWFKDYQGGVHGQQQTDTNEQQKLLNDAKLQQIQQQIELSKAFAGGLPTDPNGQIDYRKAAAILASKGDIGGAVGLLQQQPAPLNPMLGGTPQGGAQPPAASAPVAVQVRPLPPPAANSPRGDSGSGTITSLVTDKLPSQNQTTGETIMKVAEVMGVDPNANLTPGQLRRAQGLIQKYVPEIAGGQPANLPPSINAGSPGVPPSTPNGGGAGASTGTPSPPSGASAPQQPLVPQEPLPRGYTDPMKAVQDLRMNAARLAANPQPGAAQQAARLDAWADRIEAGLKPVSVGASTSLVDPRTGKPVFEGAAAAALHNRGGSAIQLDADAENYRQTGKLPPNMGRGIQGQAESLRIRERAAELEQEAGGDTKDWPTRWQGFQANASGARILASRATNLRLAENEAASLIPRVREASDKINRTNYPTLNSLILAAEKGSGGEDVVRYGLAVSSLIPVYARVLKPTGQITEGDTNRAREILDKAWSKGQINAALDQMEIELGSAKTALQKTIDEQSGKKKMETKDGTKADAAKPQGTTTGGLKWSVE